MATNRKRRQQSSFFTPGMIFALVMIAAGIACLAIGFGIIKPF